MSHVIPGAASLVQHHLEDIAAIERDRLEALRASFEVYTAAREGFVITARLHAWGVLPQDAAEQATASVRCALDALLSCLDAELPKNQPDCSSPTPVDSRMLSIVPPVVHVAPEDDGASKREPARAILEPCWPCPPQVSTSTGSEQAPFATVQAERRIIAMFGGEVRREKLDFAAQLLGRGVLWFSNRQAGQLESSLKRGRVAAVVLLQGLTGHVACGQIRALCRQRGIATAFGDRAGTAHLREAFLELESKLAHLPFAA